MTDTDFAPGWGQGIAMRVHRTDENGDALCGAEVVTEGTRETGLDLVRNHGHMLCMYCTLAAPAREDRS